MEIMNLTENVLSIFRRIADSLETLAGNKHEKINWEQRRYEIAKAMLPTETAEIAVKEADKLIALLKEAPDDKA